jgi:long-chain acyl-CoA synthetase
VGINIAQVIRGWALREPARIALVLADQQQSVSFGELDLRARRAAARLARMGVRPGDRIALSVPNGLAFLDGFFGGLYAGCTLLPIPPMSAAPELAARLRHARCAALISSDATRALAHGALAAWPAARAIEADELVADSEAIDAPLDLAPEQVAMILYTSGTTGSAKGAMITHASLATHTAALVHHVLCLRGDDRILAALPLTHSYGIRMTLLAPFYAGAQSVLVERFQARRALELLGQERISWFPGVPTMFHALAHCPEESSGTSLRWCLSAGAPLPSPVRLRAEAKLRAKLRQGFGLTEATFSTVASPDDDQAADSVGRPVFGVELRIIDEQGRPQPANVAGEVCIRGQNVMAGYLDDPEATAHALRDGWLHSGDIGLLDGAGRLTIVDRIKDMIIRGGFNVYPAEVEAVLVTHESVRDAVVVGVPDERYGEEVLAVLVLHPGAPFDRAELDRFCRQQLSAVKTPRLFALVDTLPVGASGKVLRRELRSAALDGRLTLQPLP